MTGIYHRYLIFYRTVRYHVCDGDDFLFFAQVNFKAAGFTNMEFMRKGVIGDFRNYFDDQLGAEFDRFVEEKLANTDFTFEFK